MRVRVQMPQRLLASALGVKQLSNSETLTLGNGAKVRPIGGGWFELYGYHYSGNDVAEMYNRILEAWHDAYLDSPVDVKKWRVVAYA